MTTKKFTVTDVNGNVVYTGIGGDANAWAARNIHVYGDLFVHYYGKDTTILHYFIGEVFDEWGAHTGIVTEWV